MTALASFSCSDNTVRRSLTITAIITTPAMFTPASRADINLSWFPRTQIVGVGTVVEIDLYAVADSEADPNIAAMDVILTWDPSTLEMMGVVDNGPYLWLASDFLPDADGLNDTFLDGDAVYTALANLDETPNAGGVGLWVTTFQFRALRRIVATSVVIEPSHGQHSVTVVFGDEYLEQDATGALDYATVTVGKPGDCDEDGALNVRDFAGLQLCFTGPLGPSYPPVYPFEAPSCCPAFDFDVDGDIDLLDYQAFFSVLTDSR